MATVAGNVFYIGNFAIIDTDDSNFTAENASDLLGSYDKSGIQLIDVAYNDANNDGGLQIDNGGQTAESITYDSGGGAETSNLDSLVVVTVRITEADSTVRTVQVALSQLENGDVFIGELGSGGSALDNLNIATLEIISIDSNSNSSDSLPNPFITNTTVCFVAGTRIRTQTGDVNVEDIRPGDKVWTLDRDFQEVIWHQSEHVSAKAVCEDEKLRPIVIKSGALGAGMPEQSLKVSRQHRVAVHSKIVRKMVECDLAVMPAKDMLELKGVYLETEVGDVTYVHFACKHHELISANGLLAETLYPGIQALRMMAVSKRDKLIGLLDLESRLLEQTGEFPMVRPELRGQKARHCLERHRKNRVPLLNRFPMFEAAI